MVFLSLKTCFVVVLACCFMRCVWLFAHSRQILSIQFSEVQLNDHPCYILGQKPCRADHSMSLYSISFSQILLIRKLLVTSNIMKLFYAHLRRFYVILSINIYVSMQNTRFYTDNLCDNHMQHFVYVFVSLNDKILLFVV